MKKNKMGGLHVGKKKKTNTNIETKTKNKIRLAFPVVVAQQHLYLFIASRLRRRQKPGWESLWVHRSNYYCSRRENVSNEREENMFLDGGGE